MKINFIFKVIIISIFLSGCGSSDSSANKPKIADKNSIKEKNIEELYIKSEYVAESTYWCIPQLFGIYKDVPKYCASGTYTNKHIPLAFFANDSIYHVFTNLKDNNFYVYAMKNNEEKVLIHTIENWNDPHTNAIIHVLKSGIVHVHIASSGLKHKFKSGIILESKTNYELDFECIDGCENVNFESYPQVWETKWGEHVGYTHYMYEENDSAAYRKLWYRVGEKRQQLVDSGGYGISYYNENNETLYVAYNELVKGSPDNRINLNIMKTLDGTNWTSIDNKKIILPIKKEDKSTLVYESDGKIYLKDLTVDSEGLKVLFTEASHTDPTKGERFVKQWKNNEIKTITETNHNYNAGAYIGENILLVKDGIKGWTGGYIVLYENYIETQRNSESNCNYIRKVVNS